MESCKPKYQSPRAVFVLLTSLVKCITITRKGSHGDTATFRHVASWMWCISWNRWRDPRDGTSGSKRNELMLYGNCWKVRVILGTGQGSIEPRCIASRQFEKIHEKKCFGISESNNSWKVYLLLAFFTFSFFERYVVLSESGSTKKIFRLRSQTLQETLHCKANSEE